MKRLRWEYRVRLFVILIFFVSCAILVGIFSLLPSYIFSRTQEQQALQNAQTLEQSRQARGIDQIEKDLTQSQALLVQITRGEQNNSVYSDTIQNIALYHTPQVAINSIDFSTSPSDATTTIVIIQGKALTRDALIDFEAKLKKDAHFAGVELPISDLTQSKNVPFALRFVSLYT